MVREPEQFGCTYSEVRRRGNGGSETEETREEGSRWGNALEEFGINSMELPLENRRVSFHLKGKKKQDMSDTDKL